MRALSSDVEHFVIIVGAGGVMTPWFRGLIGGLLVGLVVPALAEAQLPNLFEASGQYMPSTEVPDEAPLSSQVTSFDVALNIPVRLTDRAFLIPGLAYHVDSVSFSNRPEGFTSPRAFHSVEIPIMYIQLLPRDWSLAFRFAPGLAGDFYAIDADLLRLNGVILATKTFSEKFTFGFGGLAGYSFGQFLPLPALYADWRPVEQFRLETFAPAFFSAKYIPHNRIELGGRAEFQGNEYGVRFGGIRDEPPCADGPDQPADPSLCLDNLAYSVGSAGLTLGLRLFKTVWFEAYGAYAFFRRFEPRNADGDSIGIDSFPSEFFVRLGFVWRIPEPWQR